VASRDVAEAYSPDGEWWLVRLWEEAKMHRILILGVAVCVLAVGSTAYAGTNTTTDHEDVYVKVSGLC
jgi:hypothetical protein